jgi:hypothetical protein
MPSAPDIEPIYPLAEAVARWLPGGHWTVASLRTEIRAGRLRAHMIAGKMGVTETAIREMIERCRVVPKDPASISDPHAGTKAAAHPDGSSATDLAKSAQDAALATAQALKRPSRPTSPRSTTRGPSAARKPSNVSSWPTS